MTRVFHFGSVLNDYSVNRVFHFETERQTLYYARRHFPGSKRIKTLKREIMKE